MTKLKRTCQVAGLCLSVVALLLLVAGLVFKGAIGNTYRLPENAPESDDFKAHLRSELALFFFGRTGENARISYDLLNDEPEGEGLGVPKIFVWVTAVSTQGNQTIAEGLVEVGVNATDEFTVMKYVSRAEILSAPQSFATMFPDYVVSKVKAKLG
jgi:hypothetical protein